LGTSARLKTEGTILTTGLLIKILYCAASIQGVFLALLIFRTKVNQPANKILGILLLLMSFHLVLVGFDERGFFMTFPHLSRISWIIGTLYWPLLFYFVQFITRTQPVSLWRSAWTFIPFLVFLIIMLPYYTLGTNEKRAILDNFENASAADFGWINQIISGMHIFFQGFLLVYYLRYEKHLFEEYSEVESMRIEWLKQFLVLVLAVTVIGVFSFFARSLGIPVLSHLYSFHFIGIVFLFYWLSYKALTQPVLFGIVPHAPVPLVEQPADTELTAKYRKSSLEAAELTTLFEKVKSGLAGRKLFLKPDLTLTDLSGAVEIPKHQLSQVINTCYSGNFFDLVNDYRVQEFKRLATSPEKKHLSMLGIAQESGFNSKASFYNVFRKKTGMTPTEYLEEESKLSKSSLN
jgi:AraC-like DNA-binding protein